jgi:hypothetical protein
MIGRSDANRIPRRAPPVRCERITGRRTRGRQQRLCAHPHLWFHTILRGLLAEDGWLSIEVHRTEPRHARPVRHRPRAFSNYKCFRHLLATAGLAVVMSRCSRPMVIDWHEHGPRKSPDRERVTDVLWIEEEGCTKLMAISSCGRRPRCSPRTVAIPARLPCQGASWWSVTGPGKGNTCSITAYPQDLSVHRRSQSGKHGLTRALESRSMIRRRSLRTGPTSLWRCPGTSNPS